MSAFTDTSRRLSELALTHDAVLVMFSGGKDSLATLDLCHRAFRRVVGVFMYFVPGLQVAEERLDFARQRWGVDFLMLPHWMLGRCLKQGLYCFPTPKVPELKLQHIHALAREKAGIDLIAHGGKKSDGMWRRRTLRANKDEHLIAPLHAWNKFDVQAYLSTRGIEAPAKFDLGLDTKSLLWLHDQHPADYAKVLELFPFAEAVVKRREFHGVA